MDVDLEDYMVYIYIYRLVTPSSVYTTWKNRH